MHIEMEARKCKYLSQNLKKPDSDIVFSDAEPELLTTMLQSVPLITRDMIWELLLAQNIFPTSP